MKSRNSFLGFGERTRLACSARRRAEHLQSVITKLFSEVIGYVSQSARRRLEQPGRLRSPFLNAWTWFSMSSLFIMGHVAHSQDSTNATSKTKITATETNAAKNLFNGKDLAGWKITDFGGHGEVLVENKEIKINMGAELTGISWTNANFPKVNYEISLEAMKRDGNDFFCGLTIPVSNSFCSFIVGGWGGGIVGISSVDRMDASENDTSKSLYFERNRWYKIRVRVTPEKIEAWIDDQQVVDLLLANRKISMRFGDIELSQPMGICTYQTSATLRNIKLIELNKLTSPAKSK